MSLDGPPITPEQVSALGTSAEGTAQPSSVGSAVLPCRAWKLSVTVESAVPFHPETSVTVSARITAGGDGYSSARTLMDGPVSPPAEFNGSGRLTYGLSASADKWKSVATKSVSVSPRVEPFTAVVQIQPIKPWVIFKVIDARDDALLPKFSLELKLGTAKKTATSVQGQQTLFTELQTETSDGRFTESSNARTFDVPTVGHPDEVWEFVSLASA